MSKILQVLAKLSPDFLATDNDKTKKLNRKNRFIWKSDDIKVIKPAEKTKSTSKYVWKKSDIKIVKAKELDKPKNYSQKLHKSLSDEAHEHLNKVENPATPFDKQKHLHSIIGYNMDSLLNKPLRTGKGLKKYQKSIDNLKAVTNKPTKHNFHAYRFIPKKIHDQHVAKGDIIHDKGFTSTSISPNSLDKIKYNLYDPNDGPLHHYKIHITPGTKGHYISAHDSHLENKNEHEFLLHPGTKFKVGKTEHDKKLRQDVTHLHIHSQED